MSLISLPLKAIVGLDATAANEAIPSDLEYCDGRTLSAGTHDIGGGVSSFTLPELRNRRLLGADPTKGFGVAGDLTDTPGGGPGPGATGGASTGAPGNTHMPPHSHSASTDAFGGHNHVWTVFGSGGHLHGPSNGQAFLGTNSSGLTRSYITSGSIADMAIEQAAGATSTNDNHNHVVTITPLGAHAHGSAVDSANAGSGTTFDIRSVFVGTVWCMKVRN